MMRRMMHEIISLSLLVGMLVLTISIQQAESSEPPEVEWDRTYGGPNDDMAYSVVQTSDGGYAIGGETYSFGVGGGGRDSWLVKTDSSGNAEWNKTYGGTANECIYSVIQTDDGGYTLAGYTGSFPVRGLTRKAWLVKTDENGNAQWDQTYGGTAGYDEVHSMIRASDGGYAMAGYTESFGAGGYDFWLVKTDADGNMEWNRTYGGPNDDMAYSVVQTSDGGYAIGGQTNSFSDGRWDIWLIKTNSSGEMQWDRTYGRVGVDEQARSMIQTADGGYALAGALDDPHYADVDDFLLVKTDSTGHEQWSKTYGGTNWEFAFSVVQTSDGGYAIGGQTKSFGAAVQDAWLVKTDTLGNSEWNLTYGGPDVDVAFSSIQTSDGEYVMAGYTKSFGAGQFDVRLARVRALNDGETGLFWMKWWFWTIIGLCLTNVVSAFFALRYRHIMKSTPENITSKETKHTGRATKTTEKTCPNCGAQLPAASKFCGKCGTQLNESP